MLNDSRDAKWGLEGMTYMIRQTREGTKSPSIGVDLVSLGLSLNSHACIHPVFVSPYADAPQQYAGYPAILPSLTPPPPHYCVAMLGSVIHLMPKFSDETLLYIFHAMPRDKLQDSAAAELYARSWRFHLDLRVWFMRDPTSNSNANSNNNNNNITSEYERGIYFVFDVSRWERVRRELTIYYSSVDDSYANTINPASASTSATAAGATGANVTNSASVVSAPGAVTVTAGGGALHVLGDTHAHNTHNSNISHGHKASAAAAAALQQSIHSLIQQQQQGSYRGPAPPPQPIVGNLNNSSNNNNTSTSLLGSGASLARYK